MTYDAAYFIAKFEGMPEGRRWCTNVFHVHTVAGGCAFWAIAKESTERDGRIVALATTERHCGDPTNGKDAIPAAPTPRSSGVLANALKTFYDYPTRNQDFTDEQKSPPGPRKRISWTAFFTSSASAFGSNPAPMRMGRIWQCIRLLGYL